jgi:hypothetical protein
MKIARLTGAIATALTIAFSGVAVAGRPACTTPDYTSRIKLS